MATDSNILMIYRPIEFAYLPDDTVCTPSLREYLNAEEGGEEITCILL